MAHVERGRLVPDTAAARKVLAVIGAVPRHRVGDRFVANNRVPPAQRSLCNTERPTRRRDVGGYQ
jgi:hypothetical protein